MYRRPAFDLGKQYMTRFLSIKTTKLYINIDVCQAYLSFILRGQCEELVGLR
jgi:hypothetical protein